MDHIARLERLFADQAVAIDKGAVGAAAVFNQDSRVAEPNLGMQPGNTLRGQQQGAVVSSADAEGAGGDGRDPGLAMRAICL
jgi:hypothetical protein